PRQPTRRRELDKQIRVAHATRPEPSRFVLDDLIQLRLEHRVRTGQIAQHRDPRYRAPELVVLKRPPANLLHRGPALTYGKDKRMVDPLLRRPGDLLLKPPHELSRRHDFSLCRHLTRLPSSEPLILIVYSPFVSTPRSTDDFGHLHQ